MNFYCINVISHNLLSSSSKNLVSICHASKIVSFNSFKCYSTHFLSSLAISFCCPKENHGEQKFLWMINIVVLVISIRLFLSFLQIIVAEQYMIFL